MEPNGQGQELEQQIKMPTVVNDQTSVQPIGSVTEQRLVGLIGADYSWEQIIYDIIASEGLDPWNLDLAILASSFLDSIKKTKDLDFRIPAKYVIISSTLLKMKSDYLKLVDIPGEKQDESFFDSMEEPPAINGFKRLDIGAFELADKRRPTRKIVVTDLINALKRALRSEERRDVRTATFKEKIKIGTGNVAERINSLYKRIHEVLGSMQDEEVKFSKLVPEWKREHVINTFLPLIYLDHSKKVYCRQDNFFEEIYVKKTNEFGAPQDNKLETNKQEPEIKKLSKSKQPKKLKAKKTKK